MVSYPSIPQFKITIDSVDYISEEALEGTITLIENGFDIATILFNDYQSKHYPTITTDKTAEISFKDASESVWTKVFSGIIRPIKLTHNPEMLILKCDGAGYGFGETACGQEYGVQSQNPTLDTIKEISEDIIANYVNKILGGGGSGYAYTSVVDTITGTINYLYSPFKPCYKTINDLLDIVQAIKGANAGPHWIITTNNKLLLTTVANHSAAVIAEGWTTYYGGSQENATLTQGKDFTGFNLEKLSPEANYILYYAPWQRPILDIWTEGNASEWACTGGACTVTNDASVYMVGSYSILCTALTGGTESRFYYPSTQNLGLDLTGFGGKYNPAEIHFYIKWSATGAYATSIYIRLWTSAGNYFYYNLLPALSAGVWKHFALPLKTWFQNERYGDFTGWSSTGAPSWANINAIEFAMTPGGVGTQPNILNIDGLFFKGHVLRSAKNSTNITANKLRLKVLKDDIAKDDSGKAADDTGTIARLAYAELLRCQTAPLMGSITTPLIKDLLPGQLLHIHAKPNSTGTYQVNMDMRVSELTHSFGKNGFLTSITLTSDVANSLARRAFDDLNKVLADARPGFQDRQATSLKAREIDITQTILEKDYPS